MYLVADMDKQLLERTARELVASGKGILAADESNGTMSSRLEAVGIKPSPEARRTVSYTHLTLPTSREV